MLTSQDLAEQFQQGAYRDYTLNEYEALRYFVQQTQPATIKCVGGYTNMDLFYSHQDLRTPARAWNWDACGFLDEDHVRRLHDRYQRQTEWQGQYTWIPRTVGHIAETGEPADLLWLNGLQEQVHDMAEVRSCVMVHYGSPFIVDHIVRLSKRCPIRAMGRRMAILSTKEVDMTQGPFPTRLNRFFHHEQVVEVPR